LRVSKKKIISIMLLSLLTIIIAYMIPVAFYETVSGLSGYSPDMLDSSITVEIQHPDGITDSYQSNSFPVVNRGDVLTARIPLPDQIEIKDPAFCFHVYQSVLTLYCGDRAIYHYGGQLADAGHMIGGIYTSVVLPPDAAGQVLTLRCEVQEQHTVNFLFASYIIPISFIYLMFMLILSFLMDIYASYQKQQEARRLECLAYTDCLTGLSNRSVFEREMDDLTQHPAEPFSLIYFDLNHLKLANDRYGHDMGDHYLKKAAEFIASSCPEASAVCRIGGDEFVAIFRKKNIARTELAIRELDRLTADINSSGAFPFLFSISYGVVQSTAQAPLSPDEALKKADSEMYLCKKRTYLSGQDF